MYKRQVAQIVQTASQYESRIYLESGNKHVNAKSIKMCIRDRHCIKIHHFHVQYGSEVILEDVNLHIHCGKLHVLIGRNGAGKSTLIKAILGEVVHQGKIVFQTPEGRSLKKKNVLKIGYVPQRLNIEKGNPVSVYDFMDSYMSSEPVFLLKRKKTEQKIKEALSGFHVDDCIGRQLSNLSGGQLQRVLLSLAIINEPNLLLCLLYTSD